MADVVLEARGLSKDYGNGRGILDLDLQVEQGTVFGFLGPNGAGKSTTIRVLLDLLRPTAGQARVLGKDPRLDGPTIRHQVGYLPGELVLPGGVNARRILQDLAHMRGRPAGPAFALAERLGLDLDEKIRRLSKGNKQKVGLVQAFFHRPHLLILDEPTDGLDPLLRAEVHAMIEEARDRGQTVFLSSHVIHEVEQVCDRVAIIREGRLQMEAPMDELRRAQDRHLRVRFGEPVAAGWFEQLGCVDHAEQEGQVVRFTVTGHVDGLVKALAAYRVEWIQTEHEDLEQLFMRIYGGDA